MTDYELMVYETRAALRKSNIYTIDDQRRSSTQLLPLELSDEVVAFPEWSVREEREGLTAFEWTGDDFKTLEELFLTRDNVVKLSTSGSPCGG